MKNNNATWIWYFGDFEIHRHMLMSLEREERGLTLPVIWKLYDCNRLVSFRKKVDLLLPERIKVTLDGVGHVTVDGIKQNVKDMIQLEKGEHTIEVFVGNSVSVPAIFVEGDTVVSDESWSVSCLDGKEVSAGSWNLNDVSNPPSAFELPCDEVLPKDEEKIDGGILYDFGRESFIKLKVFDAKFGSIIKIYYGESSEEALGREKAIIFDELTITKKVHILPVRACRFVFLVSDYSVGEISGLFEYLPLSKRGRFVSSDELLNKIYSVSEYTLRLNSRIFFTDGIKRDRWVWCGDAYQSYFSDYYMYFDEGLFKRTAIALRGGDPIVSHINTIVDYSLYWIISMENHLLYTGDDDFIRKMYNKMTSLIEFCISRCNSEGLLEGQGNDWTFIDWADMEKHGALCAIQMLYCKSLEVMTKCSKLVGNNANFEKYKKLHKELKDKIVKLYWNKEKGAFVTTYSKGKPSEQIRRHANLFALLFGFANDEMTEKIKSNVIFNDEVPEITTPYFKFFELEVLCKLGEYEKVLSQIKEYWGGMLNMGATSFWEEYDPKLPYEKQFEMYGDPFGKSLCHAWGASPLYIIGRYFLGVSPIKDGYREFEVNPKVCDMDRIEGIVPIKNGSVYVKVDEGFVTVITNADGGYLIHNNNRVKINKNETLTMPL